MKETVVTYEGELGSILEENREIGYLIGVGDVLLKTLTGETIKNQKGYCSYTLDHCLYFFNKAKQITNKNILGDYNKGIIDDYCNKRISKVQDTRQKLGGSFPRYIFEDSDQHHYGY